MPSLKLAKPPLFSFVRGRNPSFVLVLVPDPLSPRNPSPIPALQKPTTGHSFLKPVRRKRLRNTEPSQGGHKTNRDKCDSLDASNIYNFVKAALTTTPDLTRPCLNQLKPNHPRTAQNTKFKRRRAQKQSLQMRLLKQITEHRPKAAGKYCNF